MSLLQFRQKVADCVTEEERLSNPYLLRWLVARDYDIAKSENMLRAHKEWRKEKDVDNILTWEAPEVIRLYYAVGISGYDKDNSPVVVVPVGHMDLHGLLETAGKTAFLRFTLQLLEQLLFRMKSKRTPEGEEVTRLGVIFDFENFPFRLLSYPGVVDLILELIRNYEANYPETLKAAWVVNAPRFFAILFGMIKPLLSAHTMSKIQIYGHEPNKWKKVLLDAIPANQFPKHWGGDMMNGNDEFCSTVICMGGQIPAKYYANGKGKAEDSGEDLIAFTVGAGSKFDMEYDIALSGSLLKWTFRTEGYDIGFSIKYNDKEEVVPYRRVESHKAKEEGQITCENTGKYVITFDNSYSRLRSKSLRYLVTIMSKDGIVIEEEDVDTAL